MAKCVRCGSTLKDGALYCHRCGLKIDDSSIKEKSNNEIAYSYLDKTFEALGLMNKIEGKLMGYYSVGYDQKDDVCIYLKETKPGKKKSNLLVKNEMMLDNEYFLKYVDGFSIRKKKNNRLSKMVNTRLDGMTISDEDIIGSVKDVIDSKKAKEDISFSQIVRFDMEPKTFDTNEVDDLNAGFIVSLNYKDKKNNDKFYAFIFLDNQTFGWHKENKNDIEKLNKESDAYFIYNKYLDLRKRGA